MQRQEKDDKGNLDFFSQQNLLPISLLGPGSFICDEEYFDKNLECQVSVMCKS
jgi:hypothetical protein